MFTPRYTYWSQKINNAIVEVDVSRLAELIISCNEPEKDYLERAYWVQYRVLLRQALSKNGLPWEKLLQAWIKNDGEKIGYCKQLAKEILRSDERCLIDVMTNCNQHYASVASTFNDMNGDFRHFIADRFEPVSS